MTTDTTLCPLYHLPHPLPPTPPAAGIKAWRQASAEAQQRQQRYAIAAARWRNMGLSKAWSTWRAWAADQQYKRQALAVAAGQWRNVRLGAAFRTWRQRTQVRAGGCLCGVALVLCGACVLCGLVYLVVRGTGCHRMCGRSVACVDTPHLTTSCFAHTCVPCCCCTGPASLEDCGSRRGFPLGQLQAGCRLQHLEGVCAASATSQVDGWWLGHTCVNASTRMLAEWSMG
jgi:hypothetical protein